MDKNLTISSSPHIRSSITVAEIMRAVIIALIPASCASIYFFRFKAVGLILTCIAVSVLTEAIFLKARKRKTSIADGSAILTGLLLALTLPPGLPLWVAALGSIVAVTLGKQIFGGLGHNIFNPALIGRAFLMAAFPVLMTTWIEPITLDAVTRATPLGLVKFEAVTTPLVDLFLGKTAGSLGETSALALIIGAVYLLVRGYMDWRIPLSLISTTAIAGGALYFVSPRYPHPLFHILAGGLMLGALFMATDPVTTPITKKGRWIFGAGSGLLLIIIRLWGGLPEGMMYSILLMNAVTPLINRCTRPRPFGGK